MNGDRPEISICAPAYDEEACIEEVVRSWLAMLDGSTPITSQLSKASEAT